MLAIDSPVVGNPRRPMPGRSGTAGGGGGSGGNITGSGGGGIANTNANQLGRPHRSASNNSSTSSDILVAPGPPASVSPTATSFADPEAMETRSRVVARVHDGHIFVVQMKGYHNKQFFTRLVEGRGGRRVSAVKATASLPSLQHASSTPEVVGGKTPDDLGRNHRGTFSKQHVLQHPEIAWVHRGQGRYLPASEANRSSSTVLKLSTHTPVSERQQQVMNGSDPVSSSNSKLQSRSEPQSSSRSPREFRAGQLPLGHHSASSPTTDQQLQQRTRGITRPPGWTSDQGRSDQQSLQRTRGIIHPPGWTSDRAKSERRSSRVTAGHSADYYNQDEDEDDEEAGLQSDMEQTFDKAYVDAHPNERFYHTGNGWYKRGDRPRGRKSAKRRDTEGHALGRTASGEFTFDPNQTIHVSQLAHYDGVEFHHCGNGWYKPLADPTGYRTSTVISTTSENEEPPFDDGGDGTVDKEYTRRHPEVEWVHRGNGRYRRKSGIAGLATSQPGSQSAIMDDDEDDDDDDDGDDMADSSSQDRRHGQGRSRRTHRSPRDPPSSSRRRVSAAVDDSTLYSKAYVKAHPGEVFHHRGQGRYARGPRPRPDDGVQLQNDEIDMEALVDTDYVESHPEETFHHRGQGRWARGMPPPGASNKVAIRGPGARERSDYGRSFDEDEESSKLPPLSALLLKTEGPDKYPHVNWYYRGGGKWARITKHDWEALQSNTHARAKPRNRGLRTSTNAPGAQLRREAAEDDEDGYPRKRRRLNRHNSAYDTANTDKHDSYSRRYPSARGIWGSGRHAVSKAESSEAPTPKPRVMTLEEDPLDDNDLPSLYKESFSPSDSDIDDEAGRVLQATFEPLTRTDLLLKPLTKHDPRTRPTENLMKLSEWAQEILSQMQQEYLESDKITAPHARIPRKPVKGGRLPVDPQIFEDKKEADLYDYHYDSRKLGYQDPEHQRIHRDVDGRELRGRRNRSAFQPNGTLPGWDFGDDQVSSKRAIKPVTRFDGIVEAPRKRGRHSTTGNGTAATSRATSATPDVSAPTPNPSANRDFVPQTKGRWAGHIPKRIQELRRESEGPAVVANNKREPSPSGTAVRKGRPPGSKNLHKRRDAGIKKGPRKPKIAEGSPAPVFVAPGSGFGG